MDITWLLLALTLIVLFASISIVGALQRIRNASEKSLALLEEQHLRRDENQTSI